MLNVITAYLHGHAVCTTQTVYQYNSGMRLQFVGVELPQAYEVDFANSVTGSSITQVGGADGVSIPDQFFAPGSTIHAWVVIVGTDYVVTRYHTMIPISPRAVRTNETPTPRQQSAIDEAISALNDAVEDCGDAVTAAETAVSHYPRINAGYWEVWDVATGAYVSTGVQAQGPQGDPGLNGVPPEITVTNITGGHRITITDADGTKTVDVMDGTDGGDGIGISSIVKTGTSGLVDTYTITYTDGTTSTFTVTNGADGASGVGVPAGGTAGQVLSKASGTDYDTEWTTPNPVVTISGTTPAITALPGVRYICGEVATLDITLPESGIVDVVFESGSTPTVLTITPPTGVTLKWANGFDPTSLDANTTYEINIKDGLGVAGSWS